MPVQIARNVEPPSDQPLVPLRLRSITWWLIVINVIVFILDVFSRGRLTRLGDFNISDAVVRLQLWRWITYQFLHAGTMHILFNMMGLYFFGPYVEIFLGKSRYLFFYLICGVAGAGGYLILRTLTFTQSGGLVGASGSIFGVLVAAAVLYPNVRVSLALTPITLALKWLVSIFVGLAIVDVWAGGYLAGGQAAHLGGAIMGLALIIPMRYFRLHQPRKKTRFWKPGDPGINLLNEEFRR